MNPWDADTFQPLGQVVQGFLEAGSPVGERCPLLAPPSSGHSLRALALLRQTAALRKSARQRRTNLRERECRLNPQAAPLLDPKCLETRRRMLADEAQYARRLRDNKSALTARLQQPFAGNMLPVEAQHHGALVEALRQAAKTSQLQDAALESLRWMEHSFSADHPDLVGTATKCRDAFAKLGQFARTVRTVNKRTQQLLEVLHSEGGGHPSHSTQGEVDDLHTPTTPPQ